MLESDTSSLQAPFLHGPCSSLRTRTEFGSLPPVSLLGTPGFISEVLPLLLGEQAFSPHKAHLLGFCPSGHRDVIPREMGLNGGIVPSPFREGSGRGQGRDWECPRYHTGLLCPLPPPPLPLSLPSSLASPLPFTYVSRLPPVVPPHLGAKQLPQGWGSGWPWAVVWEQGVPSTCQHS